MYKIKQIIAKSIRRKNFNKIINLRSKLKKYHGLNKIDKKIHKYLNYENGFYVELGANDGINQSNTLFFERELNWTGLLIEPNPYLFDLCRLNRGKNYVVNAACVSNEYLGETIKLEYSNLLTQVSSLIKINHKLINDNSMSKDEKNIFLK
jgi:hypothetical protein